MTSKWMEKSAFFDMCERQKKNKCWERESVKSDLLGPIIVVGLCPDHMHNSCGRISSHLQLSTVLWVILNSSERF